MQSATLRVVMPVSVAPRFLGRMRWSELAPLGVPCALLLLGAVVGYLFTLDPRVAAERLIGLAVAAGCSLAAYVALRRIESCAPLLIGTAAVALGAGLWIIAATGPDVFRGTVGSALQAIFRPVFNAAHVTDPIEVSNTRFIVGYNGLADLCLVAIFCCAGAFFSVSRLWRSVLVGIVALCAALIVGTGARGALTGLVAGVCVIGIVLLPRRLSLMALVGVPVAFGIAAIAVLDKGLEFSSTAGRLSYWGDLVRLLVEYPLTGVGLGLDTAFRATLAYQINPDPERVFYAHNTFVQSYLETGPLGTMGMLAIPLVALCAAFAARRYGSARRSLLVAGLGTVVAMEAHGLTDQVVTTNIGTLIVLIGLAAVLAGSSRAAASALGLFTRAYVTVCVALVVVIALAVALLPAARAQALLDLGSLQLNQAFTVDRQSLVRARALVTAQATLDAALAQDPTHPAVLRQLGRLHSAQFDDAAALRDAAQAAQSPRIDAFDMLQIAQLYRDLGQPEAAYDWAARAYAAWGRAPEDGVMLVYAQATLTDARAQTLADQGEAAMRARHFGEARELFQQALTFDPRSAYLTDRVGAADRAVAKYGP